MCICNPFLTRTTFFNAKWTWLGPRQFRICLHPVQHGRGLFTTPLSRAHGSSSRYAVGLCHAIKQLVTRCSETLFKCSVTRPPKKVRVVHATSMNQEVFLKELCSFYCYHGVRKPSLKRIMPLLANRAHLRKCCFQKAMPNFVL